MDEEELAKQQKRFDTIVYCKELVAKQKKRDGVRRAYRKKRLESVSGLKLHEHPPLVFPENNVLVGFRRF
jgi:hypothetical protein